MAHDKQVLIFGATGNIGGATSRELLQRGWQVRAITRSPESDKARALAGLGAEIVRADLDDRKSLEAAFDGMKRALSVQNWVTSGVEGEVRQGKLAAEVAKAAGVEHLVYASAGSGDRNTGVPHFDAKIEVEDYMRELELPFTIVRPAPFMELLTQKEFYPPLAAWGAMRKILSWDTPLPWVAVHDIGIAVGNIFENPDRWMCQDVSVFGDIKSLAECKDAFVAVDGKKPLSVPIPLWLFKRMAGEEMIQMWQWLERLISGSGHQSLWKILEDSRQVCPEPLDVQSWLKMNRNGGKT